MEKLRNIVAWANEQLPQLLMTTDENNILQAFQRWMGETIDFDSLLVPYLKRQYISDSMLLQSEDTDEFSPLICGAIFSQAWKSDALMGPSDRSMTAYESGAPRLAVKYESSAYQMFESLENIRYYLAQRLRWKMHTWPLVHSNYENLNLRVVNPHVYVDGDEYRALPSLEESAILRDDNLASFRYPGLKTAESWGNAIPREFMNYSGLDLASSMRRGNYILKFLSSAVRFKEFWTRRDGPVERYVFNEQMSQKAADFIMVPLRQMLYLSRLIRQKATNGWLASSQGYTQTYNFKHYQPTLRGGSKWIPVSSGYKLSEPISFGTSFPALGDGYLYTDITLNPYGGGTSQTDGHLPMQLQVTTTHLWPEVNWMISLCSRATPLENPTLALAGSIMDEFPSLPEITTPMNNRIFGCTSSGSSIIDLQTMSTSITAVGSSQMANVVTVSVPPVFTSQTIDSLINGERLLLT